MSLRKQNFAADPDTQDSESEPKNKSPQTDFILRFNYKPRDIKKHLDRFIIGQNEAKKALSIAICDHYNHVRHHVQGKENPHYSKQNILILGPTGVGKTYLIRCLADLIGVPFVKGDATKFSETGYVGQDTEELVRNLVQQADGDIELAQYGMIYLDEIDKISASPTTGGRDVSGRGVQTNLLKLMEETDVPVKSPHDIQAQFEAAFDIANGKKSRGKTINTRGILFIVSGAFAQLPEIVGKRLGKKSMGFGPQNHAQQKNPEQMFFDVTTKDLVDYGFEQEFAGRLPVRVACTSLSISDIEKIMLNSEGSILTQYKQSLESYGITLNFSPGAISRIAELAHAEETGARGLSTVLEKLLRDLKFELPSSLIKEITIDENFIADPTSVLRIILEKSKKLEIEGHRELIKEIERRFLEQNKIVIRFDDQAITELIALAEKSHLPFIDYCEEHLREFPYGLKLISAGREIKEFVIDSDAIRNPQKTLSEWVVKSYKPSDE